MTHMSAVLAVAFREIPPLPHHITLGILNMWSDYRDRISETPGSINILLLSQKRQHSIKSSRILFRLCQPSHSKCLEARYTDVKRSIRIEFSIQFDAPNELLRSSRRHAAAPKRMSTSCFTFLHWWWPNVTCVFRGNTRVHYLHTKFHTHDLFLLLWTRRITTEKGFGKLFQFYVSADFTSLHWHFP